MPYSESREREAFFFTAVRIYSKPCEEGAYNETDKGDGTGEKKMANLPPDMLSDWRRAVSPSIVNHLVSSHPVRNRLLISSALLNFLNTLSHPFF
jgi:hypothetical protein